MSSARFAAPALASLGWLAGGCGMEVMTAPPYYSEQVLESFCDHGKALVVSNRGVYDSRYGGGELLLAAQLTTQPVEAFLNYQSVRLEYLPDTGLNVTLVDRAGAEVPELIPADWIRCPEDAMELDLPSDAFYVWASVGVKTRRLRLQVAPDGGLVMRHLWTEKGMAAVVIPLKISGDGWASFPRDDPANYPPAPSLAAIAAIGACQDLGGMYSVDGTSVRLDGSVDYRNAEAQFFRPEIMGAQAVNPDAPAPTALRVAHAEDGGILLTLLRADGSQNDRRLDATRLSCEKGHWVAHGDKEMLPALMLLLGSGGASWEDLQLSRGTDGALLVRGTYRSRGAIFLIPAGNTSELFMRFPLAAQG